MARGKQAKIITHRQEQMILRELDNNRYPKRDKVMLLLSVKAGLRAKEIACLTWEMVMDSGSDIGREISLENRASKGRNGGRVIPLHPTLRNALNDLYHSRNGKAQSSWSVIHSERGRSMSPGSVAVWFHRLYQRLGLIGCSSHTGRRTFITRASRKIVEAGGSLRDVQQLAGHASLATTQLYIEGSSEAKRRVVELI